MKATGIVRRIDDLGRVVIPKEIRRTMRIREGDPLEIYTEKDGEVIFKKYSPMGDRTDSALALCETINKTVSRCVAIADRDSYISAAGVPRSDVTDRRISAELEKRMEARRLYQRRDDEKPLPIIDGLDRYVIDVAAPILAEGDVLGCVVFFSDNDSPETTAVETKLAQTAAAFLGKQMEI